MSYTEHQSHDVVEMLTDKDLILNIFIRLGA